MLLIEQFAFIVFAIQIIHSLEELLTGFHKKWYLFHMPFKVFLGFEIIHTFFWLSVLFYKSFPFRENLLGFFLILMFANGIQHVVWAGSVKKYVPGLITGILHIILFIILFYTLF